MKFSAREDIESPIDTVFDRLRDFEKFEKTVMRRGVEVRRITPNPKPDIGTTWEATIHGRRKPRQVEVVLARLVPSQELVLDFKSSGLVGTFRVDTIQLSRNRTRLAVSLDFRPETFAGRLTMQSLRLAKTSLTKRFKLRVADYAYRLEAALKRAESRSASAG